MKNTKRGSSFVKQAAILATAGLVVRFMGFLYRVPMTNMIGDEGNAIYNAGYNIYNFLLILSSAGLPAAVGKLVSERIALKQYKNAHKVFRVALMVSSTLGFIFMLIMIIWAREIANATKLPESYYTILTLSPTVFIVAIMSVFRGYFQGMNTMVPTAISQVVEQLFNAFFSVLFVYLFIGIGVAPGAKNLPLGAAGGTAGTGIGALAGLMVVMFSYMLIRPSLHRRMLRESRESKYESRRKLTKVLIFTAAPIIMGTAIFSITNLLDTSMVMSRLVASGAYTSKEASVLYGQLGGKYVLLTTLPVSISTAMATAAVPNIAASVVLKDHVAVKRKINMAIKIAMMVSIPAAVGMGVLGDQILLLLFPMAHEGGILLRVGSVSIIFLALYQILTGILQGIGKVHIPVIGALCGAAVKIALNYILIVNPKINILGAVLSTTGCYIIASIINLIVLIRITHVVPDLVNGLAKPIIAALVMGVSCYSTYNLIYLLIPKNAIATLSAVIVSIIIYGVFMLLMKGITKDDVLAMPCGTKISKILGKFGLL